MTDSPISTPKRLLRILLGGAILATAWVAIELITHSDAASAVEVIDVQSIGSDAVADVVTPLVAPVVAIAAPPLAVVGTVVSVVEPVLEPVVEPVFEAVVPLVPAVTEVVGALPALPQISTLPSAADLLSGDGLDVALATSNMPLVPTPAGGVPRDLPAVPTPSIEQTSPAPAVMGAAFLAPPGSALTLRAVTAGIPPSPTYGFDTTPD